MDDDDNEGAEKDVEAREPQVTSSDPNERILARKLRIERRLEAIRKLNSPEGEEEISVVHKTLLQQQLQWSYDLLEKLTIDASEHIANVRVANDSREVDRREREKLNREKIVNMLQEEAASAEEQFSEIADRWLPISRCNDPLQINDEILNQKEKCDAIIRQKDEFIAKLKNEIKNAELNFSTDQKKQMEDIQALTQRIENQVVLMRSAYANELKLIENVIMIERKLLMDVNNKKWDDLYKKRDHDEAFNGEKKTEQLEEFEVICTQLRIDHQENYRKIKIKLENDIENLEKEFEKMKRLASMNSEKLDYNYQILKKREDENILIKSQQKRRINKLQDSINTLRRKTRTYKTKTGEEIEKLTMQVKKNQASVLDVEEKADRFAQIDDVKYKQIWDFNKKRATSVLDEILLIDKVLYEQQLGLHWVNPEYVIIDKADLPSYKCAMQMISNQYNKGDEKIGKGSSDVDNENDLESSTEVEETLAHRRILKVILKMIADKSGFLIEEKLKEVLEPFTVNEKKLVRVDNVFSALEIKREEDIEILLEFFLPYTHCPICMGLPAATFSRSESVIGINDLDQRSEKSTSELSNKTHEPSIANTQANGILSVIHQPNDVIDQIVSTIIDDKDSSVGIPSSGTTYEVIEEEVKHSVVTIKTQSKAQSTVVIVSPNMACHNRHPLVISSIYILRALRDFLTKFCVPKEQLITMASRLNFKRKTVTRLIDTEDVEMYWDKFKTIFSPAKEALWDGLMIGLKKYHEILKDRQKLSDEVTLLRKQNGELRHLLGSYKRDVEKKMKPPCAVKSELRIKPLSL